MANRGVYTWRLSREFEMIAFQAHQPT
jgi:hypothetical protein